MKARNTLATSVIENLIQSGQILKLMELASNEVVMTQLVALAATMHENVVNATSSSAGAYEARTALLQQVDQSPELLFLDTSSYLSPLQEIVYKGDAYLFSDVYKILAKHNMLDKLREHQFDDVYGNDYIQPVVAADELYNETESDAVSEVVSKVYIPAQQMLPLWLMANMFDLEHPWNTESNISETLPVISDSYKIYLQDAFAYPEYIHSTFDELTYTHNCIFTRGKSNQIWAFKNGAHCEKEQREFDVNVFCSFFSKAQDKIKNMIAAPALTI